MSDKEYIEWLKLFIQKQKPLGEKFEKVLFDNLWNLYELKPPEE